MRLRTAWSILLSIILFANLPLNCIAVTHTEPLSLSAKSAILIDLDEKTVLYRKNEKERMPMASTTKIVTALVTCELLECNLTVQIPQSAVGIEGSSVYLQAGELLTVEQLLYALLLESANDAAVALAICASGSIENFAEKCNEKAYCLGLRDTSFTNPHGLYDENHYTTAYDLAILSAEALKNPTIAKICSTKRYEIPFGVTEENPLGEGVRYLKNHNKMLSSYEGAIGVKTGFTKKSGRCLISAARRGGLSLIAVTLNAPDDWRDHSTMLDFGFEHFERRTIFEAGEFCYNFPLSNGQTDFVKATNLSPISILVPQNASAHTYSVESCFRFAVAPTQKGQIIGKLCVYLNGKEYTSTLVCTEEINKISNKHSFFN